MLKIEGTRIYLAALEKDHCRQLYENFEYDEDNITEPLNIGHSMTKSDDWFDEIQKNQGNSHIRLGIFLMDGKVIGDIALQDIDWKNRSCSLGMGFAKIEHRNKGYGGEAIALMLAYAFDNIGLERITANTLEQNISAQKSLEKVGFVIEGRERKAVYFAGKRYNRLNFAILADDYRKSRGS
jgi:RimJ/RimL family protein N-acetyltransferase